MTSTTLSERCEAIAQELRTLLMDEMNDEELVHAPCIDRAYALLRECARRERIALAVLREIASGECPLDVTAQSVAIVALAALDQQPGGER